MMSLFAVLKSFIKNLMTTKSKSISTSSSTANEYERPISTAMLVHVVKRRDSEASAADGGVTGCCRVR